MRRMGPEDSYIREIDPHEVEASENDGEIGEEAFIEITKKLVPGLRVRRTTELEDAGKLHIGHGQETDTVSYWPEGPKIPASAWQITVGFSRENIQKKMESLMNKPFATIEGRSIPRVVVPLDRSEAKTFLSDLDLDQHKKLVEQFFEGTINSLRFVILRTKDPKLKAQAEKELERFLALKEEWQNKETK
ncbi:MAG: hypothetical protein ACM3KM_01675 [Acidobacteriaceae bacterium]